MSDLNVVALSGRSTRDVELKYTQTGTAVADGSLAVNRFVSGEEKTSFVDLVYWGKTAEVAAEYVTKGKQIAVSGRLEQQTWEKDGQKRSKLVVVVENLQLLGSKSDGGEKPASTKTTKKDEKQKQDAPPVEEEIPF